MGLRRRKQIKYSYKMRQIYAVNCSEMARSGKVAAIDWNVVQWSVVEWNEVQYGMEFSMDWNEVQCGMK